MAASQARHVARLAAAAGVVAALAVITGCDTQENADLDSGRTLFQQNCGTCHTLAEAGTSAQVGPNLDRAFTEARANGMDQDTIEGVVEGQIAHPRPASPDQTEIYMPANLVTGEDATDVAAYVASVAGIPGIEPPQLAPPQLFAEQCGICHALKAAGTTATTGPPLDEVLPGQSAARITESIVEPDKKISPGYQPGIMPPTFGESIPPDDLKALVQYLRQSVGGGG